MKTFFSIKSHTEISELQMMGYIIRLLGFAELEGKLYESTKLSTDDIFNELKTTFDISKEDIIVLLEKMYSHDFGILFKESIHTGKTYWGFTWLFGGVKS